MTLTDAPAEGAGAVAELSDVRASVSGSRSGFPPSI